ncbi:hypothetical protein EV652_10179 [Kribbella steppae]|uniref:Uncharacterized protein n=1 Tax=Kribbella steppae TaxID=2512223 RepID=A0A4V2S143_9ACTN|nr:hypothetical protein [Kribbella steppae]TCO35200.1 hypothetical protein EV652_10179 [Kribbella steppae]
MSQQYPQPPHVQMQPPKKNTTKTALIIVGSIFGGLVLIGILGSLGGGTTPEDTGAQAETTPTTAAPKAAPSSKPVARPTTPKVVVPVEPVAPPATSGVACEDQDDRTKPCAIKVGVAFKLGSHTVQAGWKTKDSYDSMTIVGKAKNTDDKSSTMFVHIKFLKGDEVLANVMCNTGDLEPGQVEAMNCIPDGTFTKKYDKVTVEATF